MTKKILILLIISCQLTTSSDAQRTFNSQKGEGRVEYIENRGQWAGDFHFKAAVGTGTVFLQSDGFVFDFVRPEDMMLAHDNLVMGGDSTTIHHHAWKVKFIDCNPTIPVGEESLDHYYNYIIGNNPLSWQSRIHPSQRISYKDLWPGIDLEVFSQNGNFKYQFMVDAGVDPSIIRLEYEGLENIEYDSGSLLLSTSIGDFYDEKPISYQLDKGTLNEVQTQFRLDHNQVTFKIENYDISKVLIVDPTLVAATFVGATADAQLLGRNACGTADGSIILLSMAYSSVLPATTGAYNQFFNGEIDLGISKFSANGQQLVWATYLGGSKEDKSVNLLSDNNDNIYITGITSSPDFPILENSFDDDLDDTLNPNTTDVFIISLQADGIELLGSTYFGSSIGDGYGGGPEGLTGSLGGERFGLEIDATGNIVLGTTTGYLDYSGVNYLLGGLAYSNFNMSVSCFSSDLSQLYWCTLIGTTGNEHVSDIEILSNGEVAVCGGTGNDLMPVSSNVYQNSFAGGTYDGWLGILNGNNGQLIRSTFFGTANGDEFELIEEDNQGNIWLTGGSSGDIPQTNGVYSNPESWRFIAKFSLDLQDLLICSRVGGNSEAEKILTIKSFQIDECGRIYVSGHGTFPILESLELTDDALFSEGGMFFFVYENNLSQLEYAMLHGGNHTIGGISRYDKKGIAYQAVCSHPSGGIPFQALSGAFDETQSPNYEAAVFKIDFDSPAVVSSFTYQPQSVCVPYEIEFSNWSDSATFSWSFGDGLWQNIQDSIVTHTFTQPGDYVVQLAAFDINSCNVHDTSKVLIHVPDLESTLEMNWQITEGDLCQNSANIIAEFIGTGTDSLWWNFDEEIYPGIDSLNFYVAQPGNYPLQLIAWDQACNLSDTLETIFNIGPPVQAEIEILQDANGCVPQELIAQSISENADSLSWLVNEVAVGNATDFNYTFLQSGTYEITLIATAETGCVQADTTSLNTMIYALPTVSFSMPDTLCKDDGIVTLTGGIPSGGIYSGDEVSGGTFNATTADTGLHTITYTYTDMNGCVNSASAEFVVDECIGINESEADNSVHVFPNPAKDELTILTTINLFGTTVDMHNALGEKIQTLIIQSRSTTISIRSLAAGNYWLLFQGGLVKNVEVVR